MSALAGLFGRRALVRSAQVLVGALFAWAALAKLGDIPALARDIHNFRLLPHAGENLLAMVLPWIELVAGLSLLLGVRPRAGALVAVACMGVFTVAVALALARGLNIECGCFGTASARQLGATKLLENVGLLAGAALGMVRPHPAEPDAH